MEKIIIVGSGGHAISCIDVIVCENKYIIEGIVAKDEQVDQLLNYKIIAKDENLEEIRKNISNAFIGIGQIKDHTIRLNCYKKLLNLNFKIPTIKSPNSYLSKYSVVGNGCIIMHGAIINANVDIGENNIINSKSLIEHDTKIGNNCHISTGAIINGGVLIEDNCFIGSGAIIYNNIKISKNSIIPAGKKISNNF